jgi:hypothetical protein
MQSRGQGVLDLRVPNVTSGRVNHLQQSLGLVIIEHGLRVLSVLFQSLHNELLRVKHINITCVRQGEGPHSALISLYMHVPIV